MFRISAVWGVIAIVPLYFLFDSVGSLTPPPVTHPEFYYGFAGVALAWQFAFFVIGAAPDRFRPLMIPAVLEKASFVSAVVVLYLQHRITSAQLAPAVPDGLLGILFTIAFFKTKAPDTTR